MRLTSEQAERLGVSKGSQISPYLELCCLRVSANVSYQHAEADVSFFTGMRVSAKTQQRLVQRQNWEALEPAPPEIVDELSIDGGQIRLASGSKENPEWRQYKAVQVNAHGESRAWFQDNAALVATLQTRPLNEVVVCLGDGHDGIWNLHEQIIPDSNQRLEILDWFHLMENLHKVTNSAVDLAAVRTHLWAGDVPAALNLLKDCTTHATQCFRDYLLKHQHRIPNYDYFCSEGLCSIGSGAVESLVKQIDRRVQISGSRWNKEHVPNVLAQRCAYLNEELNPATFILLRR